MKDKYVFNPTLIPVLHLLHVAAIALGVKSLLIGRLVGSVLILLGGYLVFFCRSASADQDAENYYNVIGIATLMLSTVDDVFLQKYQREPRKIGQKKPTSEMSLRERFWWAATLCVAARGVGWQHEPTSHLPPRPTQPRSRFILSQLVWLFLHFIQLDIASTFMRAHPSYAANGPSFAENGWLWRITVWIHVVAIYQNLAIIYTAVSILGVALGLSKPEDWPYLFGSPTKAYTVQNVWGRCWHQMLRKMLTTSANFGAQSLNLKNGLFTKFFKLFVAFFLSGILHYVGEYFLLRNWSGTAMQFFILQAIAITVENIVIALAKRLGFKQRTKTLTLIGYIWVFIWLTLTLPPWLDPTLRTGVGESMPLKVSLISGIFWGDWTPRRKVTPSS